MSDHDPRTWHMCLVCGHWWPHDDDTIGCGACERGEPVFVRPPPPRDPLALLKDQLRQRLRKQR